MAQYELTTALDGTRVVQTLEFVHNNVRDQIYRVVVDTAELHIRNKLIELGWTPPKEELPE